MQHARQADAAERHKQKAFVTVMQRYITDRTVPLHTDTVETMNRGRWTVLDYLGERLMVDQPFVLIGKARTTH